MQIAVVIPTLNEQSVLTETLLSVTRGLRNGDQIVVVDGGSDDQTLAIAGHIDECHIVHAEKGRGKQLDAGAKRALELDVDLLLFLHADSTLPSGWRQAFERQTIEIGGGCLVHFRQAPPLLRLGERLVNWRTKRYQRPLGDQAQFATRRAYLQSGGYPHWPILEDTEFRKRLEKLGPLTIIPISVTTDTRRFTQRGVVRTVVTNWLIWLLHACGVNPRRLALLYRNIR